MAYIDPKNKDKEVTNNEEDFDNLLEDLGIDFSDNVVTKILEEKTSDKYEPKL